ncbi:MAG: glycoside hydrolase [Bacteroidales bacterium]|jgi:sialidase-1|nr:glycoside hydrolase [Bacteroidales bacterium]
MKKFLFLLLLLSPLAGCVNKKQEHRNVYLPQVEMTVKKMPVLSGKQENAIITLTITTGSSSPNALSVTGMKLRLCDRGSVRELASVMILHPGKPGDASPAGLFGEKKDPGKVFTIRGSLQIGSEPEVITISFIPREDADITAKLSVAGLKIFFSDGSVCRVNIPDRSFPLYFGKVLRSAGQDNCHTYRIPGLVTTSGGTLIAVYDNRYNRSKDLQEDIDIGMSRSTDGGQTWEPMKVIMDMNEYGGRPEQLNGTGDPCILCDHNSNTLWVAALWMSGASPDQMLWYASKPGMLPEETGQFLLVKSTDDGITWSDPINITGQIKDPSWQLLLQGPGSGLTMKNGTLVFPAQFKADLGIPAIDGGQYTCHSTIVYSSDGGATWKIGTGAKPNTTEAQVVELSDGSLMLNMRDDRNRNDKTETNGRAVAVTRDMGKTWTTHPSSNSALPEPNCMASLISVELPIEGTRKNVLFFSNPDNRNFRRNMSIKASLNEGLTWPQEYRLELYDADCYGYSCLTAIDEKYIGILYEGAGELCFQKIPFGDILESEN